MNDIINKLMQLGFSSYEAKAYVALLQKHPTIGYEVSKISKIPTSKIYETLISLKNKGAIMVSNSEPVNYYPIPPETLLKRLKNDFVTKIDDLEGKLSQVQPFREINFTWNVTGYNTVIDKIIALIDNATESLLLSVWPHEARLLQDCIRAAEKRGVKVIIGVFGSYDFGCKNTINLQQYAVSSVNRFGKYLTVTVGDSKEVIISEINHFGNTVGLWTTTPGIVLVANEYIKHDIWGRILVNAIGEDEFKQMCEDNDLLSYLIKIC